MSSGNDFVSGLIAQGSGASSQSFATGAPDPAAQGISNNVKSGTVNLGSTPTNIGVVHHDGENGRPETSTFTGSTPVTSTVDQAALALFGMSKGPNGQVAQLQQKLKAAGYLTKIRTPGMPDDDTARAYGDLLQQVSASNQAGDPITVDEFLQKSTVAGLQAAASDAAAGVGVPNGLSLHTSNPMDISETAQAVAQRDLGRKLNPKELQKFVSVYQGIEAHKNAQAVSAVPTIVAGGNVTTQDAPSVEAAADNYAQTNYAGEYGAANVANTFDTFRKLIT
jgi:hypothetical protein